MKKNINCVFGGLLVFGIGVFLGYELPRKTIAQNSIKEDSFQAGWDAAREKLKQSPFGYTSPSEITSLSGTITKVDGNRLEVKINSIDPLSDSNLDIRNVLIDFNTKLLINESKNSEQLQKEMEEFEKKMLTPTDNEPINPPVSYEKKEINVAQLKENQKIYITAKENIKDLKEFTALQIDAQELN